MFAGLQILMIWKGKKRKFVDFERKFINGINKSRIIELKKL